MIAALGGTNPDLSRTACWFYWLIPLEKLPTGALVLGVGSLPEIDLPLKLGSAHWTAHQATSCHSTTPHTSTKILASRSSVSAYRCETAQFCDARSGLAFNADLATACRPRTRPAWSA